MLANKRAGEVLKYLPRLVEGGIAVNCQLVLCRGINDGDELRRTLSRPAGADADGAEHRGGALRCDRLPQEPVQTDALRR